MSTRRSFQSLQTRECWAEKVDGVKICEPVDDRMMNNAFNALKDVEVGRPNPTDIPVRPYNKYNINDKVKVLVAFVKTVTTSFPYFSIAFPLTYLGLYKANKTVSDDYVFCLDHPWKKQIYTYALQHSNIYHVTLNAASTMVYGSIIEIQQRSLRIAVLHTLGLIIGALSESWHCILSPSYCTPTDQICLIGASAGFYALISSYIGHLVINWKDVNTTRGLIWRYSLMIMGACGLLSDIIWSASLQLEGVSYYAHFGGFITGLTLSPIVYRRTNKEISSPRYTLHYCIISIAAFISYLIATIVNARKISRIFIR